RARLCGGQDRGTAGREGFRMIPFTVENHVARVTIDRPDRLNAVDAETEAALIRAWEAIERDDSVRCVVLTGAGDRAFCAGADMRAENAVTGLDYWARTRLGGF